MTFNPSPTQLNYIIERGAHRYNYVLKSRQTHLTTLHVIDNLDEALWTSGMTCATIAHQRDALDEIFQMAKRAFEGLPDEIKPKVKTDTVKMYRFTHRFDGVPLDSSYYVALKLRSGTVQNLHITESAFIKDRQELKAGSKQAVPKTGRITEETTGNGFNDFYDDYEYFDTMQNPSDYDYRTYFIAWIMNPEYTLPGRIEDYRPDELKIKEIGRDLYNVEITDGQLLWRRWKMNDLRMSQEGVGLTGAQLFKQEYPLTKSEAFQSAAGNVYDATIIDLMKPPTPLDLDIELEKIPEKEERKRQLIKKFKEKEVKIWKMPEAGHNYVIGGDPSDGTQGGDNSSLSVWDADEKVQVAQYYGKLRPDYIAQLAAELGEFYNMAYIGIENNMLSAILFLKDIYKNFHTTVKTDKRTQEVTRKLGWTTESTSRDVMIDEHIAKWEDGDLTVNSKISLSQMKTFVTKDNGKREHADGKNDDALIADMIAVQMMKYNKPKVRTFGEKAF